MNIRIRPAKRPIWIFLVLFLGMSPIRTQAQHALVFQSDFGLKDAAVGAMKGVAFSVSPTLSMFDLTHEIPAYNIWEASYRLNQAAPYWPPGTVFVSIIDPGVGSDRKSVVARTRSGHYMVTPDNGTLTHIAEGMGIDAIREIDEAKNRLKNSNASYTFHGRDVYAYTGARLAAGVITFEEVGPLVNGDAIRITHQRPEFANGEVTGGIPVLDVQYGNIWTDIDRVTFDKLNVSVGDRIQVRIYNGDELAYESSVPYVQTFSAVPKSKELAYLNSLLNLSLGINMGSFADVHAIQSGPSWRVVIRKTR